MYCKLIFCFDLATDRGVYLTFFSSVACAAMKYVFIMHWAPASDVVTQCHCATNLLRNACLLEIVSLWQLSAFHLPVPVDVAFVFIFWKCICSPAVQKLFYSHGYCEIESFVTWTLLVNMLSTCVYHVE